jgi:hypothetical protein
MKKRKEKKKKEEKKKRLDHIMIVEILINIV